MEIESASCPGDCVDGRRARGARRAGSLQADQRPAGAARAHRVAGRAGHAEQGHRRAAGRRPRAGRALARALRRGWPAGHRARPAARCAAGQGRCGPAGGADHAEQARGGHALEHAQDGRGAGGQRQHRHAALAGQRPEAASGARLQGLARPEVRREARRHRGPVHVSARARAGAVLRREEPGAGAGPHAAGPAAEEGARGRR